MLRKVGTDRIIYGLTVLCTAMLLCGTVSGGIDKDVQARQAAQMDIIENLGDQIPLSLEFTDADGSTIKLADCFEDGKPVLMVLAYYQCPMLCTMVLNGVTEGVKELDWTPGKEFNMVTVSIDPSETPELATGKQKTYLEDLGKGSPQGWRFLVGKHEKINELATAVGFKYFYDENQELYAHPAAAYVLTPAGRISRYLYGIQFKEKELRLSLLEAANGEIGSVMNRLIMYCYTFDPNAGEYVLLADNVMRLGGAITLIALIAFLGAMWTWEWRRRNRTP